MIMEGCQGKPQISIMDKICPQCGHEIEIFSIDTEAVCENCGFTIYNDTLCRHHPKQDRYIFFKMATTLPH